jgi:hypothetical protein
MQPLSQTTFDGPTMMINSGQRNMKTLHDDHNKGDKFGFTHDEMSLHDAFTLNPLRFKE